MQSLTFYRILTWFLLIVGGFLAFFLVAGLLMALANPVLLLPLFVLACVLIYTYASWRFLSRGIDAHLYCKRSLRDLIRVNGYGALFFASLSLVQAISLIVQPSLLQDTMDQALALQKNQVEGMEATMWKVMHFTLRFMTAYSIVLIIHIFMTFRLIRQHADAFDA